MTPATDRTPHQVAGEPAASPAPVETSDAPAGGPVPVGTRKARPGIPELRVTRMLLLAALLLCLGAWAGIVPFVGPAFNFSADGTPSWTWNLAHALLGLAPGVAAVLAALGMLVALPEVADGRRRPLLALVGALAIVSGAWLVIGPFTWPVLEGHAYFLADTWGLMVRQIGYSLGPGILITAVGAYAVGWSARNGASVDRRARDVVPPVAPPAGAAPAG